MSVDRYPRVVGELKTVEKLLDGYSIARIGDGELKLITGGEQFREPKNATLGEELRTVLEQPVERCLPGVLTMNSHGPKYRGLSRHAWRFMLHMQPGVTYYSALITRPDCAPWIDTRKYAALMQKLWAGKRVALVCESPENAIYRAVALSAGELVHIPCPHRETYAVADSIVSDVMASRADVAILSAGPAATCMALRLARHGMQAIDIGSVGRMLCKWLS